MSPVISIIVPVYNVEPYLRHCLDSIIGQTLSDLEIIIVDDGSTDGSSIICDEYAARDSRIKVLHKSNAGQSSARNAGIDISTAPYIGFVDSDDYIADDMYELLYTNALTYNADVSMCGLYDCFEGQKPREIDHHELLSLSQEDAIRIVMEAKKTSVTPVNKLYKRGLFDSIRYPQGKTSEDAFVIIDLLLQAHSIVLDTQQKYYYIHRSGSTTSSPYRSSDLYAIEAYEYNYALIKKHMPSLIDTAKMRCMWARFYVLDKIMRSKDRKRLKETERQIVAELRHNYTFIMKDKRFNISRKVALMLLMVNVNLYAVCVKAQQKKYYD